MGKLTAHFSKEEMACHCCGRAKMDMAFLEKLEELRVAYGKPLTVTSGYRCEGHNAEVGGAGKSYHVEGKAADLAVELAQDRFLLLKAAFEVGFVRIGIYPRWIHVDVGEFPANVCWVVK